MIYISKINFYFLVGLLESFKFHVFLLDSGGLDPPFLENKLTGEGGRGFGKTRKGTLRGQNLTASGKDVALTFIQL